MLKKYYMKPNTPDGTTKETDDRAKEIEGSAGTPGDMN